ncbi:MAG: fasciclin domain-containing protein [Cyclobacteriaceae bacterium]|nr:fasciclin domain-containing protein [Cyclobacteriaceae bacterium]
MKANKLYLIFLMITGLFLTTACDVDDDPDAGLSEKPLLLSVLEGQSNLSVFKQLVEDKGLAGELAGSRTQDQRAIFAPTNQVFADFLTDNGLTSATQINNLDKILAYHIARPNVLANNLSQSNFQFLATANSDWDIFVNRSGGTITLDNGVRVVSSNDSGNGTIHIIDGILTPRPELRPFVESTANYSTFRALMNLELRNAANAIVVGSLRTQFTTKYRTFFVPTNDAFAALLSSLGVSNANELIALFETIVRENNPNYTPRADNLPVGGFNYLQNVLRYHISATPYYSFNLSNNLNLPTLFTGETRARVLIEGGDLKIRDSQGNVANVSPNPTVFSHGFVHGIDRVLIPEIKF